MSELDHPLYLYFLDRELGRLAASTIEPSLTERAIKALLLATSSAFYCGFSLLWESPGIDSDLLPFVSLLVRGGVLDVVSHHTSAGDFIESRRVLYAHDAERYPMYFSDSADQRKVGIEPTQYKGDSTTGTLSQQLLAWATNPTLARSPTVAESEATASAKKAVSNVLVFRDNQAVTLSLFQQRHAGAGSQNFVSNIIQREISRLYVSHYMEYADGDIPTGIKPFDFIESEVAREFPLYDIPVLCSVLEMLGLTAFLERPWQVQQSLWQELNSWRGGYEHTEFRRVLRLLLRALAEPGGKINAFRSRYAVRSTVLGAIRNSGVSNRAVQNVNWEQVYYKLRSLVAQLRKDREFDAKFERVMHESAQNQVDVLLVVVADIERDQVLRAFESELGHDATIDFGRTKTYYNLGVLGGARVVMVQSEMGSVPPGASLSTVADACDELHPKAIITVGIAFGIDPSKQVIGDVLVSKQIHSYEPQRLATARDGSAHAISRGPTVDASVRLLDRLRSAASEWKEARVNFGLVVSGEKLVDNVEFRNQLKARFPEAIGGEMEAAGAYSAAVQRNTDWIVVKSICDWADGRKHVRKKQRQELAARNAASFVISAIKRGGFVTATSLAP